MRRAAPRRRGSRAAGCRPLPSARSRIPAEIRASSPTSLGRLLDRSADPAIRAAAADVACHRGVDVIVGGMWILREQRGGGHDLAGLAVAALRHVERDPRLLHLLAGSGIADRFDRGDGLPAAALTGVTQERMAWPSSCTVHAPQSAIPQPNFVPVMPRTSRRTQSTGMSDGTSASRFLPLIVSSIVALPAVRTASLFMAPPGRSVFRSCAPPAFR